MKITVETVKFVRFSELLKGLNALRQQFSDSEPPFSWGDNNRSLVTAEAIMDSIDGSSAEFTASQVEALRKRINKLPEKGQMYVDLEN